MSIEEPFAGIPPIHPALESVLDRDTADSLAQNAATRAAIEQARTEETQYLQESVLVLAEQPRKA